MREEAARGREREKEVQGDEKLFNYKLKKLRTMLSIQTGVRA